LGRLTADGVASVTVEGGNLCNDPSKQPVIVESLVKMRYAACLTGSADTDSVRKDAGNAKLAVVPPFDPAHPDQTSWIIELGSARVACLRLEPPGQTGEEAWERALVSSLTALRKRADVVAVASRLSEAENRRLAGQLGPAGLIQAIFVAPANCTPDLPTVADGVLLCPTKDRGQAVTLLEAERAGGKSWKLSCRLETVGSAYAPDPTIGDLVGRYYQSRQTSLAGATAEKPLSEASYAPAPRCKPCHAKAYDVWQKSVHARAVATLREKQRLVPECLTCHSEQFRRNTQFDADLAAEDDGVQCSTCHGDGIVHALTRGIPALSREQTCGSCHTEGDQVHGAFSTEAALRRIQH